MTSPIYHPCSNGQAENTVKTCKKILKCILKDNKSQTFRITHEKLLDYLFDYRNTVHCTTGETPARLMFGRELRTRLDLILPKENEATFDADKNYINNNRNRYFKVGDLVWIRGYSARKEKWLEGKVLKIIGNRMYEVFVLDQNNKCIRHVDQIINRQERKEDSSERLLTKLSLPPPRDNSPAYGPPSIDLSDSIEVIVDSEHVQEGRDERKCTSENVTVETQPPAGTSGQSDTTRDVVPPERERSQRRARLNVDFKKYF